MKVLAIIQARLNSSRLPNKVMLDLGENKIIDWVVTRVKKSKYVDQVVVATSLREKNKALTNHLKETNIPFYCGSERDVLKRFYLCAKKFKCSHILRITADCPFISWELIDKVILKGLSGSYQYCSNVIPPSFPDGLDCEFFTMKSLVEANQYASSNLEREHVTTFIIKNNLKELGSITNSKNLSSLRWTLDENADFDFLKNMLKYVDVGIDTSWNVILKKFNKLPEHLIVNRNIKRNAGSQMNKSQKLWIRAKSIIAGGNHLLSKRPEMFAPGKWPAYFSKTSGISVWDIDDKQYLDFCIMGVGTNSLGYSNTIVDKAVKKIVNLGNLSSLNAPEEVGLAEKLLDMHPWADMARFARTGGEANSVAIRLARASTGRDKVAICGYHGWHDWYLSTNLQDENNLQTHLLEGLSPRGVPKSLKETVFPFNYNKINELKALIAEHSLAAVIMEVERSTPPLDNFLQKVRDICNKNGIVLIFDECTSGFRETFGGLHLKYKVTPDICMFGKALGNGYAITSLIGIRDVMECAQSSFISSTFWTERIGVSAGLATLNQMEKIKSWEQLKNAGLFLRMTILKNLPSGIEVEFKGIPALTVFTFKHKSFENIDYSYIKTYITQQMLDRGYLASNIFFASTEHNPEEIIIFTEHLIEVVYKLCNQLTSGQSITHLLNGEVCHTGFQRLT